MAGSYELSNRDLQGNKAISKRRNLRTDQPNEKSSRFDSFEYSRGTSTTHNTSISSIPVDSEGFVRGIGNADNDSSSFGLYQSDSTRPNATTSSKSGKSDGRINKSIESEGEIIYSSRPSSLSPLPSLSIMQNKLILLLFLNKIKHNTVKGELLLY
jgi:hypothetical protein